MNIQSLLAMASICCADFDLFDKPTCFRLIDDEVLEFVTEISGYHAQPCIDLWVTPSEHGPWVTARFANGAEAGWRT